MWKKICGAALLVAIPLFTLEAISWGVIHYTRGGLKIVQAERNAQAHIDTGAREIIRSERSGQFEFAPHPYFGFVHTPGANPTINKYGFVGPDPFSKTFERTFNVVVTGGSVAGNFYNLSWDRLRDGLRGFPGIAGKTVTIMSLAVAGYKQPQQLLTLAWLLSRGAKVDLVINIDGYNEMVMGLTGNVPDGVSLFYPMLWKDLTADFSTPENRRDLGRLEMFKSVRTSLADIFNVLPLRISMTANLTWSLTDSWLRGMENQTISDLERTRGVLPFFRAGPAENIPPEKILDVLAENWAASSRLMAAMVESVGGVYLHVLQPNQYVEGSKPLSPDEERFAVSLYDENGRLTREGYARLFQAIPALKASGVLFYDATGLFSGVTETLYYDTCCHFNAKGTKLLCDAILDFLKRTAYASEKQ